MAKLDTLLALPGALAAFEFRASGELLTQEIAPNAPLDPEILDLVCHMCAANMSICNMQTRGWEAITGMKGFFPVREFTLVGFDWSVVVSSAQREAQRAVGEPTLAPYQGVVLANPKADYEATFAALDK